MAGSTPYFGLAFFDFRDRLDLAINVRKEIERFLLIDKQIYGLYTIFGNGVIEGWTVSESARESQQENSISVTIEPGSGIIGLYASETSLPEIVINLPSNDIIDIYAIINGSTVTDRSVQFLWSRTTPSFDSVRLARVTTGDSSIISIDNDFRDEIGFIEIIKDEIASHKHRGSPSKIDLQQETRNQLPSSRIEDFDASKIVSGKLDDARIPQIDHNDLLNNGLLTHAALDSFVRNITSGNRELLGEVSSANLMKMMLTWKYNNQTVEDGFLNTLPIIPGITPDNFIDFDASSANINLLTNCASGKPVSIGQIRNIVWETTSAFATASDRNLVTITQDKVILTRGGSSSKFVENFESVSSNNFRIPGFTSSTEILSDNLEVVSDESSSFLTEGFYSGKFSTDRSFRALYEKSISSNRDWSLYDEIVFDIKSISLTHGAVYMYFVSGEGENATQSQTYLLLGPDEITTNPDPLLNGFERRAFSISNEIRGDVRKIVIYTDDIVTKHVFWIDNIFIRNQSLFPPEGYIRFKYSSSVNVIFNSISYQSLTPDGTDIRFRIRTANSPSLLSRAIFSPLLNSGDVFAMQGTDAEIDVVLISSSDRSKTPELSFLELQIIADAAESGFTISSSDDWDKGSYSNTSRVFNSSTLSPAVVIQDPVPVGNMYYSFKNVVSEIDDELTAVSGFQGSNFLLSPKQARNYFINQGARGFKYPFSAYRQYDRNFIISDADNDRVLLTDNSGNFIKGLGSHNVSDDNFFYPLTSIFNPRNGKLTITFTQDIDTDDLDISKIRLWIGGSPINLGSNDTIVEQVKTKKILEILLSSDKIAQLEDIESSVSVQLLSGIFPREFQTTESSQELIGPQGLEVFIGDFTYVDGIFRPIYANILKNQNWIIGNSSIEFDETSETSVITRFKTVVGQNTNFTVSVDEPEDGFYIQWQINIPVQLSNMVSYSTPPPGNVVTVNVTNTTADVAGEWTLTFIAEYRNINTLQVISSTQNQAIIQILTEEESSEETLTPVNSPSVIEVNIDSEETVFSYDKIQFSDYSLGSVYEVDEYSFLISGIVKFEDQMTQPQDVVGEETFEQEASRKLSNYRGKVIIVDRSNKSISFQYDCPDGSYASDAVVDKNSNYIIAESSFVSNSGRIVTVDSYGNIIRQIGGGLFSKINDVRSLGNDNVIIST